MIFIRIILLLTLVVFCFLVAMYETYQVLEKEIAEGTYTLRLVLMELIAFLLIVAIEVIF